MIVYRCEGDDFILGPGDYSTRKNVARVDVYDQGYTVRRFVGQHVLGSRWEFVPGMWSVEEGYNHTGHVVDDFGDMVEVCGFHGL